MNKALAESVNRVKSFHKRDVGEGGEPCKTCVKKTNAVLKSTGAALKNNSDRVEDLQGRIIDVFAGKIVEMKGLTLLLLACNSLNANTNCYQKDSNNNQRPKDSLHRVAITQQLSQLQSKLSDGSAPPPRKRKKRRNKTKIKNVVRAPLTISRLPVYQTMRLPRPAVLQTV